jgi:hypothetical protein
MEWLWLPFLRAEGEAYEQEELSPRLTQLSHAGEARLHFSLEPVSGKKKKQKEHRAYFRCLHGAHDRGTRFRLRTTLKF